jgi:hypothetical protein
MAPDVITLNDITSRTEVQEQSTVVYHFPEVRNSISEQILRLSYPAFLMEAYAISVLSVCVYPPY